MKLPNRKNATISKIKLNGYLLSLTHKRGRTKAKFFRGIGFNETNSNKLKKALLKIAKMNDVTFIKQEIKKDARTLEAITITKLEIHGKINAPNGKSYMVKTVWAIVASDKTPHLATVYPRRSGV